MNNHEQLEKSTIKKAARRAKKKRPKMRMSGKRTREITRLWLKPKKNIPLLGTNRDGGQG